MKVNFARKWSLKNIWVFVFLTKRDSKKGEERRAWGTLLVLLLWVRHCPHPSSHTEKQICPSAQQGWTGTAGWTAGHTNTFRATSGVSFPFLQNAHDKNILVLFDAIKLRALLQLTNAHDGRVTASWVISYYSCQRSKTVLFKCWFTGKDDCTSSITHTLAVREKLS